MRLVAAPASAKHQFLSDILDCRNYTQTFHIEDYAVPSGLASDKPSPDLPVGGFGISTEDMRELTSGTSNRDPLVAAVSEDAPANVQHIRSRSLWVPVDRLP